MARHALVALLICAAFALLANQSVQAAIARADFSNPTYPGKCVLDSNTIMSPGQTGKAPNHPCAGVTCMDGGRVEFRTCAAVAPPRGCKQRDFANSNRAYPECCERSYDCTKHI
ncbi:uncharacterized protein LOC115628936 [Scaptodrosophila lebanonensis]|uniref:Uncharacterized protein LOC115628936 n=1 Tax=Drosophila lebanonensis TaxID=7225 RepID=A0A6J2U0S2_DROLE|nr:uncharacterized protein LOC115628936 [Scaptodrosophila lebanonensis]